ncbi:unnamed protein product, partial [Iphiclides podalirius]
MGRRLPIQSRANRFRKRSISSREESKTDACEQAHDVATEVRETREGSRDAWRRRDVSHFLSTETIFRMEMIEIDPKLFVTCRLCLDNMGVYQIVPSVQQQIKSCYDIEVDPFDGLPQLICKDCESILSKYVEIKYTYINKQRTLKEKIQGKTVSSVSKPIESEQGAIRSML